MSHTPVTSTLASAERRRRLRAAPLGLVLLAWGLGVGPLAHAVLAHGEPRLGSSADRDWVSHPAAGNPGPPRERESPPTHRHSPGGLEHLQLALVATLVTLAVAAAVCRTRTVVPALWHAPLLRRWRLPEIPGAP